MDNERLVKWRGGKIAGRLAALDVDGTLVDSDGSLSPLVVEKVRRLSGYGIQFALASGRNRHGLEVIAEQIGVEMWFISSGGALISHSHNGIVLGKFTLEHRECESIIRTAREAGAGILLDTPRNEMYWEGPEEYYQWMLSYTGIQIRRAADVRSYLDPEPLKIIVVHDTPELIQVEKKLLAQKLAVDLAYSAPRYLEITRKGVNKGSSLRTLAEYLQIPLEQIMAVGDGENDLSMFYAAGISVAMENAPLSVRQAADMIVPKNDDDGVLDALMLLEGTYK